MNPSRVVAATGIPVFWKAARFAVRRWNGGLGRLVSVSAASSAGNERAGDSGCPKEAKEGNDVVLRHISVGTGRRHGTPSHADRDASFTRSFDPCSLILTMHRRVKPAVVGRYWRYRGQANSGNREELAPGQSEANGARLAAYHCSAMSGVMRKKRKVVEATVPARKTGADWFGCPHVDNAVAEVVRRRLVSNKLGIRAAKTAAGSSERGPSSKWTAVGETCGRVRRAKGTSGFPASTPKRERSGRRPRVARECHLAVRPSPKAVSGSRDRGCNGHRILWRVPNDRRHPSPRRSVSFHEKARSVG